MQLRPLSVFLLFGVLGSTSPAPAQIELRALGTYESGIFDEGAAEIVAHDPTSQRLFVTNREDQTIDVLDVSNPSNLTLLFTIDVTSFGKAPTSVAADSGAIAAAIEANVVTDPGSVVFFDVDGTVLSSVTVGSRPDMLTFTPNGRFVLVANEGEPSDDYTIDPEGSVSIIDVSGGAASVTQADVATADFQAFNGQPLDPSIRIYGPNATVAQDLEPEFIAVSPGSRLAWVTLQENNAIATVDIPNRRILRLSGLGFKDHSRKGNGLDPSDRDSGIQIGRWPVLGMYQPDAIAVVSSFGGSMLVTANEGDARGYDAFDEEERIKDLTLDPTAFPNAATLQQDDQLGRLNVTTVNGDPDNDGDYDRLFSYGGRSVSLWSPTGRLIWDSGHALESITAKAFPDEFNSNNDENDSFESRSDNKGPEPEGLTTGRVGFRNYLFIGLERIGGIVVVDITFPLFPSLVQYINNRDFNGVASQGTAGDLGPEGLLFIPRNESPVNTALLVVANEVSGTTTVFEIREN